MSCHLPRQGSELRAMRLRALELQLRRDSAGTRCRDADSGLPRQMASASTAARDCI